MLKFLHHNFASKKGSDLMAVCILQLKAYTEGFTELEFNKAVAEVGGNVKASLPFLKNGWSYIIKPTENWKQKKRVTIPHTVLPAHLITKFCARGK